MIFCGKYGFCIAFTSTPKMKIDALTYSNPQQPEPYSLAIPCDPLENRFLELCSTYKRPASHVEQRMLNRNKDRKYQRSKFLIDDEDLRSCSTYTK